MKMEAKRPSETLANIDNYTYTRIVFSINRSVFYSFRKSIPEAVITAVPAPDDGCQHPKHVELPTEM